MITIYAETTFVLRHAHREDGGDTNHILDANRQGRIKLVIPVLSLFEALYQWRGRQAQLLEQLRRMHQQATEFARSEPNKVFRHDAANALRAAAVKLAPVGADDRNAIGDAIDEIEGCADILQIPGGTFARAKVGEASLVKGPADALVLALILEHASASPPAGERFFLALDTGFATGATKARLKAAGITAVMTVQKLVQILQARGAI